jgi:hypothetical protein
MCQCRNKFEVLSLKWVEMFPYHDDNDDNNNNTVPQSVLLQVHSLFQSQFCTQCDIVTPISMSSILSFPYGHPVAAYDFVFPSFLPTLITSLQQRVVEGSSYARCDQCS